jgi:SAM-dependent methyltransferase
MLTGLLHTLVSRPAVYSLCQHTIGAGNITRRVAQYMPPGASRVLDIGSGPGYAARMCSRESQYFPLDIDRGMLAASHQPLAIQCDATELPIADGSMDMVLCKQVSHHIPDERLDRLFDEIRRVLRPEGRFLFMDAVRTDRAVSNLLWRYDRGAHPRPESELRPRLDRCFQLLQRDMHRHLHQYMLLLLAPLGESIAQDTGDARALRTAPTP